MAKKNEKPKYKDNLSRPFELPLTKDQTELYEDLKFLLKQKKAINMTYPELFDVLDRVKLSYQIDMLNRLGTLKRCGFEVNKKNGAQGNSGTRT